MNLQEEDKTFESRIQRDTNLPPTSRNPNQQIDSVPIQQSHQGSVIVPPDESMNSHAEGGEHDGKLQSIIQKLKKNAQENQNIQEKTVGKGEALLKVHGKELILDKRALFALHIRNRVRYFIIYVTEWKWFDRFIIFVIFLNSLFLATYDFSDRNDVTERWIELVPEIPNLRGLRTLRVLRPLRSINAIPSMKNQITSLIKSLGQLVNVLLFLMFLFIIFGILGVQLFSGQFYQRCRLTPKPDDFGNWPVDTSIDRLCAYPGSDGWYQCPSTSYCGSPADFGMGIDNENLTQADYINYGITTFDNLGVGMLTIFQVITLEGWSDLMYMLMDSGTPWLSSIYFIALVFIGQTKDQQQKDDDKKREQLKKDLQLKADEQRKEKEELEKQNRLNDQDNKYHDLSGDQKDLVHKTKIIRDNAPNILRRATPESRESQLRREREKEIHNQDPKINLYSGHETTEKNFLPVITNYENKLRTTFYDLDQKKFKVEDNSNNLTNNISQQQTPINVNTRVMEGEKYKEQEDQFKNSDASLINEIVPKSDIIINGETKINQSNAKNQSQITMFMSETDEPTISKKNRSICHRIQYVFFRIAMNPIFATVIVMLILMNTLILSFDRYPIDQNVSDQYNQINTVLTWLFFVEMMVKLIGLGPKLYSKDKFNLFDAFITCLTTAENLIDISPVDSTISSGGAISGFRAVRLFRIFKLARQLKSFQTMLQKIAMSLKDIGNFSVLLFLFLFTYTLLGMEIFSYKVKFAKDGSIDLDNGQSPRQNFDNFLHGFVTIFIVLIGDNWNTIMYTFYNVQGGIAALFFVTLQVFGKYVLLNLFLAILLQNFEDDGAATQQTINTDLSVSNNTSTRIQRFKDSIRDKIRSIFKRNQINATSQVPDSLSVQFTIPNIENGNQSIRGLQESARGNNDRSVSDFNLFKNFDGGLSQRNSISLRNQNSQNEGLLSRQESLNNTLRQSKQFQQFKKMHTIGGNENIIPIDPSANEKSNYQTENENEDVFQDNGEVGYNTNRNLLTKSGKSSKKKKNLFEDITNKTQSIKNKSDIIMRGKSFYLFSPKNSFRRAMHRIVSHRFFDPFILSMILLSTIMLAIDNPLDDPNGLQSKTLEKIDYVITAIFCMEALLKIFVFGLVINGPESYLRVSWNIMDFIIVIFSIISILLSDLNIQFIKVIRMLRVLRPLRMISRNEGLKLAVLSLINAVPSIINALVISLLFYILFGIFATNFFKGTFYHCVTDKISQILDIDKEITTKWDCLNVGGDWINTITNFDNLPVSMMSLFILSSTEGWGDIMYNGVDATEIDHQPVYNMNEGWVFFFMVFMIIGSLFLLNLFVSIVVNTYYVEKEKLSQNDVLKNYQKQWLLIQSLGFEAQPTKIEKRHDNIVSKFCQNIADSPKFDYFIIGCIIINTILMALTWFQNPQEIPANLEIVNYFFTAVFTLEAIIKIIAYGLGYFKQGWNIFDFVIVIISYVTLIIGQLSSAAVGPKQTTIARAFRIGRVFRLIKKAKFLRIIFNTIIVTIPALANVGALMFLLLFIFSILGVQTFALIKLQDSLNYHANFQNFGMAFLTLIRLQTGEGWNNIMEDTLRTKSVVFDCDDSPTYDSIQQNGGDPNGCGTGAAYAYFLSFQIIVTIIFLNLFVAVILQGFSTSTDEEVLEVYKKQIEAFKKVWVKYDPNGTGYIKINDMNDLIDDVEEETDIITVVIHKDFSRRRFFISSLQAPCYKNFSMYYFQDILSCLQKRYLQHRYVIEEIDKMEIDVSQYTIQAKNKELEFDEIIEEIPEISADKKIQIVEENFKLRTKYTKRQEDKVDKFEDKVYDSSYIVWVPVIQQRIKPFLNRILERKREHARIQNMLDRNNLSLIMETGGQPSAMQSLHRDDPIYTQSEDGFTPHRRHRQSRPEETTHQLLSSEWNGPNVNIQNLRQRPLNNSSNIHQIEADRRDYGQTGEVGGTNTLCNGDESYEHEYSQVIREEMISNPNYNGSIIRR
ncbi:voltage-gated ion channel superfamily [Stylonychia lemnae]|uniref:Voltage-gated ion channel superfamily n=1 Tax=Stylonychia lemnae TaxID=5949 RepID=A0A078ALL0_STYLE|nr:voltage-gated ion channel superfamily [Stylonychia lemnae]|eukprot:CDW83245.1 voltage-gated ion channel superfamily [Stylonychia lemnae]